MIGETIGHYRIVSKLGEGGMGAVYLAQDTKLDREVALKFLPPHVSDNPDALERFKREAKAAAALDHPNIVTVHEIAEHDGHAYIVMSYVRGERLSQAIARRDMSVDRVLEITMQICDGLGHAHKAGVVHRDIKPDNIAIDDEGRVKILDFGLAKLGDVTRLTTENSTIGTLAYMSPEQTQGDDVDSRSDLFSLGVILYEMLTGQRPFRGETAAALIHAIANDDPQPVARFNNEATPELEHLVGKLLKKDAGMRYQTAADVMADIRALRAESGGSSPAHTAPPAQTPSRRWMWPALTVVAAAVVALAIFRPFGKNASAPTEAARPMIVVLPFENLGATDEEYFADGMTEEITSRLATVTGLGVISRTTAVQYKGANKSISQIADALNVGYVLEGTVRWDKSRSPQIVRITPQLIRVSDDTNIWANSYERELDHIFEVQADIARHIAEAMQVTLLDRDRDVIEQAPTANTEAYTYYLRGIELTAAGTAFMTGRLAPSIEMFSRAVEIDPNFASAWARLSSAHSSYYHNGIDRTPARLAMAKEAAERGLALAPDAADTRMAMARYEYWGLKNYDAAMDWVRKAADVRPGDATIIEISGWILRRLGRFEEARDRLRESLILSPEDVGVMLGVAECDMILEKQEEAGEFIRRALILEPDNAVSHWFASVHARRQGKMDEAYEALKTYKGDDRDLMPYFWYDYYYNAHEFDNAIAALDRTTENAGVREDAYAPNTLLTGLAQLAKGDSEAANRDLAAAYETLVALTKERPDDHRLYSSLGLALAGLGRGREAIANGKKSVEMYPVSKDHYMGPFRLAEMARIYAIAGYADEALAQLDEFLSLKSIVNVNLISTDPAFDSLRKDPRFAELLRKHAVDA